MCERFFMGTKFVNGKLYRPGVGRTGRAWNGHILTKQEKTDIGETADREATVYCIG